MEDIEPVSDRIMRLTLRYIFATYMFMRVCPPAPRPDSEKDNFYETLQAITSKWTSKGPTYILGDFNERVQLPLEGE
eukprot:12937256-Prorocentrum_lima.AAC.1